ncbi:MAG: hypothetical protein AB7I24_15125 [Candidatus Nanopelagicales bacterium]|jgi:hypothetical protein
MSSTSFAGSARAALDPVVVPAGFVATDYDDAVTWCAAYDDLAEAHPSIALPQQRGAGACVDLRLRGEAGRLVEADFEGETLAQALRRAGLERRAGDVEDMVGVRVDIAAPVVAAAVAELLSVT